MSNMKRNNKTNREAQDTSPMEAAYKFLASRMRTVSEVEHHLSDKGYGREEIQETVNDLIGLRYIDDYQYALRYFEYNREKRRGILRAERELAARGVDAETIRNAREDFIYEGGIDEYRDALELALRELGQNDSLPVNDATDNDAGADPSPLDDRMTGRIARKLENRGYSRDIIYKVLGHLRDSD